MARFKFRSRVREVATIRTSRCVWIGTFGGPRSLDGMIVNGAVMKAPREVQRVGLESMQLDWDETRQTRVVLRLWARGILVSRWVCEGMFLFLRIAADGALFIENCV